MSGTLALAWATIRGRLGGFVAAFVAVLCGAAVITASGVSLESGIRGGLTPQRYAGADVVVTAQQEFAIEDDIDLPLPERATLPVAMIDDLARSAGVRRAIGDVRVPLAVLDADGEPASGENRSPVFGHSWSSTALGPFTLAEGRAPVTTDEVVLDRALAARIDTASGGTIALTAGSGPIRYRVVGIVIPPEGQQSRAAVFLADGAAWALSGRPQRVEAVGLLIEPGVDAAEVADRIERQHPGARAYTGSARGDAEFLDVGRARSFLIEVGASFGGIFLLLVVVLVASTLGLSIQQRRRELALLRAIGATPRQIRAMVDAETLLLSAPAATIGAVLGTFLAVGQGRAFAALEMIPADFAYAVGPFPIVGAVVLCMLAAVAAGRVAVRRHARISPVDALREVSIEPKRLGLIRQVIGWLLVLVALAASLVGPLTLPGDGGIESAGAAALLMLIAVGLVGPALVRATTRLLQPILAPTTTPAGFLADANTRASSHRVGSATVPLVLGVMLGAVQLLTGPMAAVAAQSEVRAGVRADHILTDAGPGLSPDVAPTVRGLPGVDVVTPIARTQVIASFTISGSLQTRTYPAQGLDPEGLTRTLDLDLRTGTLDDLAAETVALSRVAAETLGVRVGDSVRLTLGDGTAISPTVVATYGRGLGFGDVTLPHDLVIAHTTSGRDHTLLVATTDRAGRNDGSPMLGQLSVRYPTLVVTDRASLATDQDRAGASLVDLMVNAMLLGYLAIAVVNSLVLATAARSRELALLRLVGADAAQVRSMMRTEARLITGSAVLLGTLASLPPLVGISLGLTQSPIPQIPVLTYLTIVAAATVVGWFSIMIPTRMVIRARPIDAIGLRE